MSEQSVDILVVGDGVSARALLWYLELNQFDGSVLQVSSPELFPETSYKSTGLVAYHGMKKDISPLGDTLVEGVDFFFEKVMGTGLPGLQWGNFIDTCPAGESRIMDRYGKEFPLDGVNPGFVGVNEKAIFIRPRVFMDAIGEQYNWDWKNKVLTNIEGSRAQFSDKSEISFKKLILCSGVGLTLLQGLGLGDKRKITEVAGSYAQWKIDCGSECFGFGLGKANLIYRSSDQVLMLGGTTQKDQLISHDGDQIQNFYDLAKDLLSDQVPPLDEAHLYSGVRVKGPKRMPICEEVQNNIFVLGAAFKNGWSQAFFGANKIANQLL